MAHDSRIIPLLDPTPTLAEGLRCVQYLSHGKQSIDENRARNIAADRVRIAREAIEWAAQNTEGLNKLLLEQHDLALKERTDGKR